MMRCRVNDVPMHQKSFIVRLVLAVGPSSVTDKLRWKGGIIPSWAMKCCLTVKRNTGLTVFLRDASINVSHIVLK